MGIFDKIAEWLIPGPAVGQRAVPAVPTEGADSLAVQPAGSEPRSAEVAPEVSEVPALLPKIAATTAAEICIECEPDPVALKLLTPEQTPAQYLALLQERNLGSDMVKVLAEGLPDREGVAWAVRCALKVVDRLPVAEVRALRAAEAWVKHPTAEGQAVAGAAARKTDFQGPGAWAAQAAATAQTDGLPTESDGEDGADVSRLTPKSVCGAVMLSVSVLSVPEYGGRLLAMLQAGAGAAAGVALAGASARVQAPSLSGMPALPSVPSVPNVSVPQLSGTPGKIQAAMGAMPSVSSVGDIAGRLPGVAGAMASPVGAVVQGAISGGGAGAMAAALGSVPVLQGAAASAAGMAIAVPGVSALANVAVPNPQMPALGNPNLPNLSLPDGSQLHAPVLPAPDPLVTFRGQRPFIEIGLGIASGKILIA